MVFKFHLSIMHRIINFFLPKEPKFFQLLEKQSQTAVDSSKEFFELLKKYDQMTQKNAIQKINKIKKLEEKADQQTCEIIELLNRSLMTPYDREDIHAFTVTTDDLIDLIDRAARKIRLYKVEKIPPLMQKQAATMQKMIEKTHSAAQSLHNLEELKKICEEIYKLENEGDDLFETAISELFNNAQEKDVAYIIKFKDLYENIEEVFDKGKDLADITQTIVVKHG